MYSCEQAHAIGIPAASHELYPAALFGMDDTEHLTGTAGRGYGTKTSSLGVAYQDVIEILVRSGMTITPTAVLAAYPGLAADDPEMSHDPRWTAIQPESVQEPVRNSSDAMSHRDTAMLAAVSRGYAHSVLAMQKAGITILAGTDTPIVPYGLSLHKELEFDVQAGLTPFEAIRTATINVAKALHVEAGKAG